MYLWVMKVSKHRHTYHMDSTDFTAKGVQFRITGTHIDETGTAMCDVKNLQTGATAQIEHQNLCKLILSYDQSN